MGRGPREVQWSSSHSKGVVSSLFFWPTNGTATPIAVVVRSWSMTTMVEVSCLPLAGFWVVRGVGAAGSGE